MITNLMNEQIIFRCGECGHYFRSNSKDIVTAKTRPEDAPEQITATCPKCQARDVKIQGTISL